MDIIYAIAGFSFMYLILCWTANIGSWLIMIKGLHRFRDVLAADQSHRMRDKELVAQLCFAGAASVVIGIGANVATEWILAGGSRRGDGYLVAEASVCAALIFGLVLKNLIMKTERRDLWRLRTDLTVAAAAATPPDLPSLTLVETELLAVVAGLRQEAAGRLGHRFAAASRLLVKRLTIAHPDGVPSVEVLAQATVARTWAFLRSAPTFWVVLFWLPALLHALLVVALVVFHGSPLATLIVVPGTALFLFVSYQAARYDLADRLRRDCLNDLRRRQCQELLATLFARSRPAPLPTVDRRWRRRLLLAWRALRDAPHHAGP